MKIKSNRLTKSTLNNFKILILLTLLNVGALRAQISNDITHEKALNVLLAAKKTAVDSNVFVNIAVANAGVDSKAFIRIDGSYLGSIDVAIKKAKTSRYFHIATGELGKLTQPGGTIYNIELSNGGLITFPGGVPIRDENGNIIGAIGVSDGTIEQDHTIATEGANAIIK